jgi:hypothetical protein
MVFPEPDFLHVPPMKRSYSFRTAVTMESLLAGYDGNRYRKMHAYITAFPEQARDNSIY